MNSLVYGLAFTVIRDVFTHPGPFADADLDALYRARRRALDHPQPTRLPPLRPRRGR